MKKWKTSIMTAAAVTLLTGSLTTASAASTSTLLASRHLLEIHTLAGTGEYAFQDGDAAQAAFHEPTSLIYDSAGGNLIVSDTQNQRIRLTVKNGTTSTLAGLSWGEDELNVPFGGMNDGGKDAAVLNHPAGLAKDGQGNIYFADSDNHAIRKLDKNGNVMTIAGNGVLGRTDGNVTSAQFYHPLDVAVSSSGILYVADTLNHVIRKIEGNLVTTIGNVSKRVIEVQPGDFEYAGDFADGSLSQAKFNEPSGLAVDSSGNLYVSDTGNQRIRYIDFAKGTVTTVAGGASGSAVSYNGDFYAEGDYADGTAADSRFHAPRGLAVTPEGGLLIADSLNHVIRYLKDGMVTTVAGTPDEDGEQEGIATAAGFHSPTDVTWIGNDSFAVADAGNNVVRIVQKYQVPANLKADASIHLLLNEQELASDVEPLIVNNTTFVPLRILTEKLGFKVAYTKASTVLSKGDLSYTVVPGATTIRKKSGQTESVITLANAPFTHSSRMFLPVRFFAEEAGLDVQWLPEAQAVLIREKLFATN
ncbi:sugar lactone lactonase YvrE [Paenibacillus phyllosphaerae]|uniref:Sugar lactone lactonase YvrE n=1 Tax=Paenibacillus phyllosphaerae TaxID=274593 RepID=A0A7W5FM71_9BACL|nr:stalk domain-containing protein [Paenibacillus phyllosphaerae]MBB3109975.1 sugar lactone lactonase YvrE [Paenibacillus phyllosphaerae]